MPCRRPTRNPCWLSEALTTGLGRVPGRGDRHRGLLGHPVHHREQRLGGADEHRPAVGVFDPVLLWRAVSAPALIPGPRALPLPDRARPRALMIHERAGTRA